MLDRVVKVGLVGQVENVDVYVLVVCVENVGVGKVENKLEVVGWIDVINWLFTMPDILPFEQTRLNGSEVKFFSQHIWKKLILNESIVF